MIKRKRLIKYLLLTLVGVLLIGLAFTFAQVRSRRVTSPTGTTITVKAKDNLQKVINAARPGDTIILEAGASFPGPITLPSKAGSGTDSDFITIQSSALAQLPAGVRVTPEQAHLMPKILAPGANSPALRTDPAAHHWRFLGVEFLPATAQATVTNLIELGDDGSLSGSVPERVPHHLLFDRCYIHAWPDQDVRRGLALNSSDTEISNSYISDFKSRMSDSQAILAWHSPGRLRIINNYLEGASENLMLGGGGGAAKEGFIPSDVEIRRNHFSKRLEWRGVWGVKNLFEIKFARRVQFIGNLLEYNWQDGQAGYAIQLTVRDQGVIEDVLIEHNIIRHTSGGINILGRDYYGPSGQAQQITIRNNLFYDLDSSRWGGADHFLQITETEAVVVDHNTVLQGGSIISAYGKANTNFRLTNNIVRHNAYGIFGDGLSPGNVSIGAYFPGAVVARNVLIAPGGYEWSYPAGNFYPGSIQAVGFVDRAANNFSLAATSRYKGRGTDGKDIGCDMVALKAALAGVAVGL